MLLGCEHVRVEVADVVVVGAGVSGITAAHHLSLALGSQSRVVLLEASDSHIGGRVRSDALGGKFGSNYLHKLT
jgi:phytoene dehydrogenase-like protein